MKSDLSEEIRKLKGEGNSLRKIAATLHLSHEAVRKRLKNLEGRDRCQPGVNFQYPSLSPTAAVNPSRISSHKPTGGKIEVFPQVTSEIDNLFEEIKEFLETKGIEVYRMQVRQRAYQVKHRGQTIRFYVERR